MSRKLSPWCKKVKKKLIDLDMTTTELAEVIGLSGSLTVEYRKKYSQVA